LKKIFLVPAFICFSLLFFLPSSSLAFNQLSPDEANQLIASNPEVVVVDVRSNIDYCYYGHIPCALNLVWESEFTEKYTSLPTDAPIITVCQHGIRGAQAAAFLSQHGYTMVHNISGGMVAWQADGFMKITCQEEDPDDCARPKRFYFPHIASGSGWETEITVINLDPQKSLTGSFHAYDHEGQLVDESVTLTLAPNGRKELKVGTAFKHPERIAYIFLTASQGEFYGYLKFFSTPVTTYRAAIPAPLEINHGNIALSHIVVSDGWWTGVALLNTSKEDRDLTFSFNTGLKRRLKLAAGAYKSVSLADIIGEISEPSQINSAVISDADGVIGLEIFGHGNQLGGISLRDKTVSTLFYPYIVDDREWWTGMVVFNPGQTGGTLTIKPFTAKGQPLEISRPTIQTRTELEDRSIYPTPDPAFPIAPRTQLVGTASYFGLPENAAWMMVESTVPVTGFELFGTTDQTRLAGYTGTAIEGLSGIFPKMEDSGWTGIALVNTSPDPAYVVLEAFTDAGGQPIAAVRKTLQSHERLLNTPGKIFTGNLGNATYIRYSASAPVVAFQLNGTSLGLALDALPGR
jgi:rhodanese-related sulfurtransferase